MRGITWPMKATTSCCEEGLLQPLSKGRHEGSLKIVSGAA